MAHVTSDVRVTRARDPCARALTGHFPDMAELKALILVCTLKASPETSSSDLLARQVGDELASLGCTSDVVRVVDENVRFGVSKDEGDGDGWPAIRDRMLAADIVVLATPIWMGQPSSVCKVAHERLDAELGETDDLGRMSTFGKVGAVAVVGNEDGAHHVTAEVLQALNDTGFTIPANASTYWVGEAMQGVDYKDKTPTPAKTAATTRAVAVNSVHLATLLKGSAYPPQK